MTKRQQIILLVLTYATMLAISVCISYRGLLLPTFKTDFDFDNKAAGFFISISQLVSIGFTYYSGLYCNRIGQARLVFFGSLLVAASCLFTATSQSYWALTIGFIGISSGVSVLVLTLNTVLPLITLAGQTILMNLLHFCYGFGTTLTQKAVGVYLTTGLSWRHLFTGIGIIFVILALAFIRMPIRVETNMVESSKHIPHKKFAIWIILGLSFYIVSEFIAGSWLVNYFKEGYQYSEAQAVYYTTIFFLTFTVGRLLGGFIMEKMDFLTGIILCTVGASICIGIGAIVGPPAFIMIGISGLFYSVIYPTTITLINYIYKEQSPYFIGVLSTVAALAIFAFNLLYGYLNDFIGVVASFHMVTIAMILSTAFFILAKVERKHVAEAQWQR